MNSPLARFSVVYVIGGLALVASSAYLADETVARSLLIVWTLVGVPLFLIVFGRLNRDTSDSAALMYLVGLAILGILLLVGLYRLWPVLDQLMHAN